MHGPLSEIGLVEVLQLLERGARSGVLRVEGPDPTAPRVLGLHAGRIVAIDPDTSDRALSRALTVRAMIPPDGLSDERWLDRAQREAFRERLAARTLGMMLHWSRGRFDFEEGPVGQGPLALSIDALLLEAVGREGQRVELSGTLRDFHAVPDWVEAEVMAQGTPPELTPLDWRILDAVDGLRDVAALAATLDEPLEEVAERVLALQAATILELRAAPHDVEVEARAAIEAGRYEEAIVLLRARVAAMPADGSAWRALGLAEIGAGRFDRAIDAWDSWRRLDPAHTAEATALSGAARTMLEALHDGRE